MVDVNCFIADIFNLQVEISDYSNDHDRDPNGDGHDIQPRNLILLRRISAMPIF